VLSVLKSGSLDLLEHSGSVQACNGIALPLPLLQTNSRTVTQTMSLSFYCTLFPIHSPVFLFHINCDTCSALNKLHSPFPHQKPRPRTRISCWEATRQWREMKNTSDDANDDDWLIYSLAATFAYFIQLISVEVIGWMNHSAPNENHRMPFIHTLLLETVFTCLTTCSSISCGTMGIFHIMRRRSVGRSINSVTLRCTKGFLSNDTVNRQVRVW